MSDGATIKIALTDESLQVIKNHAERPSRVRSAVTKALGQGLGEIESHLKANYFGGYTASRGSGGKIGIRSGALRQAIISKVDEPMSGYVGTAAGPASKYARTILGGGSTTIRPVKAKHLWIPVGDNLTRSGRARISPREAFEKTGPKGGKLLSIFKSKSGNLVAVLRGKVAGTRMTVARKRGGTLLFVLKKSVTIKGTDALANAVQDKRPRLQQLLQNALVKGLEGEA